MAELPHDDRIKDLSHRIDAAFSLVDYESLSEQEWTNEEEDTIKPLLSWERELIGRDICSGIEVLVSDRLALLENAGELVMERMVCIEAEDANGEELGDLALNVYNGEIFYEAITTEQQALQDFEKRFNIIENI